MDVTSTQIEFPTVSAVNVSTNTDLSLSPKSEVSFRLINNEDSNDNDMNDAIFSESCEDDNYNTEMNKSGDDSDYEPLSKSESNVSDSDSGDESTHYGSRDDLNGMNIITFFSSLLSI